MTRKRSRSKRYKFVEERLEYMSQAPLMWATTREAFVAQVTVIQWPTFISNFS